MHAHALAIDAMPIRTNRVATLLVIVGIVGAAASVVEYVLKQQESASTEAATAVQPAAADEKGLCKLARDLAESEQANLERTAEGLRKAASCPKPKR
jgi:hypothetical protein